jgi:hypothetical protein
MESLGRFVNCDSQEANIAGRMLSLAAEEDKLAGPVFFQTRLRQANGELPPVNEPLRLARYAFERMSEWLEAILHWRVHWMSARAPITNQPTEELRELAQIGIMQAGFARLGEHRKEWRRFRHEDLATRFHGKPEWRRPRAAAAHGARAVRPGTRTGTGKDGGGIPVLGEGAPR